MDHRGKPTKELLQTVKMAREFCQLLRLAKARGALQVVNIEEGFEQEWERALSQFEQQIQHTLDSSQPEVPVNRAQLH